MIFFLFLGFRDRLHAGATVVKCMATSAPDDVDVDRHALLEEEVKVGIFALCVFAKERNG